MLKYYFFLRRLPCFCSCDISSSFSWKNKFCERFCLKSYGLKNCFTRGPVLKSFAFQIVQKVSADAKFSSIEENSTSHFYEFKNRNALTNVSHGCNIPINVNTSHLCELFAETFWLLNQSIKLIGR